MPAIPSISPSLRNWPTRSSPRPSMSIAPRLTNCFTAWNSWPGQPVRLGQIVHTPSSGRTVAVPHAGHFAGAFGSGERPFRFWAFAVGDTTRGITSPARVTITSSPSRTSLRAMSSSLWSVASFTVTPDTCTGVELGEGHHVAGAAHVPHHPLERGGGGHRRELPGDRAARLAPHHAEPALQLQAVHLHHHAVDLEVQRLAPLLPAAAGGHHLVERVPAARCRGSPGSPCSPSHSSDSDWLSNSIPSSAPTE